MNAPDYQRPTGGTPWAAQPAHPQAPDGWPPPPTTTWAPPSPPPAPAPGSSTPAPHPYPANYGPPPTTWQQAPVTRPGHLAPHWKRAAAWLLDQLPQLGVIVSFVAAVAWMSAQAGPPEQQGNDNAWGYMILGAMGLWMGLAAVVWLITFIVNACLRQGRTGQTWGKRRMGLATVSKVTGRPAGAGAMAGRHGIRAAANLVFPGVGFAVVILPALFTANRATLSDLAAGTIVVELPDAAPGDQVSRG